MKLLLLSISFFFVVIFSGCGGYKEGLSVGGQKSYLYFSGDINNTQVSIDDGAFFSVKSGIDNQYQTRPGKHDVKVYRENEIVVHRSIYLGDGVAKEIEVP